MQTEATLSVIRAPHAQQRVWLLCALAGLCGTLALVLFALNRATPVPDMYGFRGQFVLLALAFGAVGQLLARHRPENPIGWLFLIASVGCALEDGLIEYAIFALRTQPGLLPGGVLAGWVGSWFWFAWIGLLEIIFLIFPTGQLPSPRWRPAAWAVAGTAALAATAFMTHPGLLYVAPYVDNPFALGEPLALGLARATGVGQIISTLLICASLGWRFWHAGGVERQQLKWFAFAAALIVIIGTIDATLGSSNGVGSFGPKLFDYFAEGVWILLAFTVAFAILRYRLWDIDLLINRTLVYGALSAAVMLTYAGSVGLMGALMYGDARLSAAVVTLLLSALFALPLHARLKAWFKRATPVADHALDASPDPAQPEARAESAPHARWFALAQAGWVVCAALAVCLFVAAIPRGYMPVIADAWIHIQSAAIWYDAVGQVVEAVISLLVVVLSLGLAGLLFWKRRADGMALFVSFYLLAHALFIAGALEAFQEFQFNESDPLVQLGSAIYFVPPLLLLYLFPNGRFVPSWTRRMTALLLIVTPVIIFKDTSQWAALADPRTYVPLIIFGGLVGAGIHAQVYRYRRAATLSERQQIKWVGFGIALYLVSLTITSAPYLVLGSQLQFVTSPWLTLSEVLWRLVPGILPVTLTVAVMRYRLWAVDVLIHRTLVYGGLTAGVGALYIVLVGAASAVSQTSGNLLVTLLATGLIAILFQPLRERLQRAVNRLLYGERDEPTDLMARLGAQLETADAPEALLATMAETIARALKLPYAAIELTLQDAAPAMEVHWPPAAAYPPAAVLRLPLSHQQETVGALLVAQRSAGEPLSAADLQLLRIIARQAGMAVRAVRLSAALQHSREQLVVAREEERRRIRRDLHDGLGPALASLAMQADEAREWTHADPDIADHALAEITSKAQAALQDIRRLVYDLRPPALDELGLVGALRQTAANAPNGLLITIDAPAALPALSAAVEVAAYRIAQEALNNVARHAHAQRCVVRLWVQAGLHMEIGDDGIGLPTAPRAGVGLISMRERAAELGGSCVLSAPEGGGTRVSVQLPLAPESDGHTKDWVAKRGSV